MFKPLKQQYQEDVVQTMMKEFGYTNVHQVPKIQKVTVNVGLGEALNYPALHQDPRSL